MSAGLLVRISEFVARLKGWQVFLGLMVPMVVSQMLIMSTSFSPDLASSTPPAELWDKMFRRLALGTFLMLGLMFTWLLSVGFAANRRIPDTLRPNGRLALAAAIFALGYMLAIPYLWPSPSTSGSPDSPGGSMALIVPLHLLAMVGIFYVLRFAAKNLVMAEKGSPAKFGDYATSFFLMWFYPVGIWFLQPRLNRLVERTG